jgi:Spy/CpxP family protein refolding chaperone
MKNSVRKTAFVMLCITTFSVWANSSPYAGQQTREIKSLSESDIKSLNNGEGWGLAKPAELNGVPGPAHILELKKELTLSSAQIVAVQTIWNAMNLSAREYGQYYLESEAKIEAFFQTAQADETQLSALLTESANHLAKLRQIHLQAHLQVKPVLTHHQLMTYQQLRGYANAKGHTGHKHSH